MKKILFLLLFINFTNTYSQESYERVWGSLIPIYNKPEKPFSAVRKILSTPFIAEVNPNNGNLYVVSENFNEIIEYNRENSESKLIHKIPYSDQGTLITQMKIDSKNNIIIAGRTVVTGLSTANAFSKEISTSYGGGGYTFISKINSDGSQAWFTYFYDIPQNATSLAIDKDDNIYVVNKRLKEDVLSPTFFQASGDLDSKTSHQDVISKLNTNGEHIWSTFYAKDDSKINTIMASDRGLYVYGMHLSSTSSSGYFGTPGSLKEITSAKTNATSNVFLSKFSFDGKRLWSTYFGGEKSYIPYPTGNVNKNPSNLTVIGDDVYFICLHSVNASEKTNNFATASAFMKELPLNAESNSLTKFNGNGNREWTTYLPANGNLFKSLENNALVISSIVNIDQNKIELFTNKKSYQSKYAGMQDIYTYTLSLDGKKQLYSTFYGYEGNDEGFSIPTLNGFYTIGFARNYPKEDSNFADKNAVLNKYILNSRGIYVGNFLSFFAKN